ncbi:hypothetical protein AX17_004680 [Amanita inopinata Kibby_2008]|nr:hypothetical protein AX17_004680 [Amanita inopinata Kibby_2008]
MPSDWRFLSSKRVVELYKLWLTRSGTTPLSVQLYSSRDDLSHVPDVLDLLMQCNHRLESTHMGTPYHQVRFKKIYGDAPLLRSFIVHPSLHYMIGRVFPFSPCPSLVELHWADAGFLMELNFIPWYQLTHLQLKRVSLFTSCPKLVQTRLEIDSLDDVLTHPYSPRITHYNLRGLELVGRKGTIDSLVDSIILPALSSLYIQDFIHLYLQTQFPVLGANHLKEMLIRSACKLQRLCLEHLNYDSANLLDALNEALLERLTFNSSSSEVLCLDLKEIWFKNYGPRKPGMLARMVASRFEREDKDGRLERFEFHSQKGFVRDGEVLIALKNKGHLVLGNFYFDLSSP